MPRLTFTPGEILTAANLNVVSDQTVMVFDDAAARTAAIPSPIEGMVTYLKDTDNLEKYTTDWVDAAPGKILQVVSTAKTDTFSSSSTTFTALTGLSVSITPTATSSKIFIHVSLGQLDSSAGDILRGRIMRDSTAIALGAAAGSRSPSSFSVIPAAGNRAHNVHMAFLDSPSSTSAIAYSLQLAIAAGTMFVNRASVDSDSAIYARTPSTITLMEVAG